MSADCYENYVDLHNFCSWTEVQQSIECIKRKIYFKIKLRVLQIELQCKGFYLENLQFSADKIFFFTKSEN
jgi:hypothetical protein